ncbi:hypothetical protein DITRI_Ditri12bG0033900 [Diplodiscus trichospermus]
MAASKMLIPSLTQVRPLTCAATSSFPARLVPKPPDLLKWVKREGGFVHEKVKTAQDTTYGLGLEPLAKSPKALLGAFDRGTMANEVGSQLSSFCKKDQRLDNFWWPYISNLPETFSVSIFFTAEDIKNLQYAPLLYQVNKRCRFLLEFEQGVKNALKNLKPSEHPFGGQDVDASSLGWAMSAVSSRAFRLYVKKLPDGTHSDIPMMLPLIGMCNHSFNPNARILQEQDAGNPKMLIKVVSEREIRQNDPILRNYGCLSNDFFLLDYGFVILSNPYDNIFHI